jgi:hypothetical protein
MWKMRRQRIGGLPAGTGGLVFRVLACSGFESGVMVVVGVEPSSCVLIAVVLTYQLFLGLEGNLSMSLVYLHAQEAYIQSQLEQVGTCTLGGVPRGAIWPSPRFEKLARILAVKRLV